MKLFVCFALELHLVIRTKDLVLTCWVVLIYFKHLPEGEHPQCETTGHMNHITLHLEKFIPHISHLLGASL